MSLIQFWDNLSCDIDLSLLASQAVPVKGALYENPCRFLEIYGNLTKDDSLKNKIALSFPGLKSIYQQFLPQVTGVDAPFGKGVYQPPFVWNDCSPESLAINFTYTTNATYRILKNLSDQKRIPVDKINALLDQACLLLSHIYKANNFEIIKYMNNNINMFIISKVVETLVGKRIYDSTIQELDITKRSLAYALDMVAGHVQLSVKQQMALAVGKGVAFIEKHLSSGVISATGHRVIGEETYRYYEKPLALDDRDYLIKLVSDADAQQRKLEMCAILDDTAETVDDLLWMQHLMTEHPHFHVNLLVNTAQISINFSSHMLEAVFRNKHFDKLLSLRGKQFFITEMYCPLISFQPEYFEATTKKAVEKADFLYIKGLNFFETCQLPNKEKFYAFVVYGPISRMYTGLKDYDAVFAHLFTGVAGYEHNIDPAKIKTLVHMKKRFPNPLSSSVTLL